MQIKRFNFEKLKMVKEHLTFIRRIRGFYMHLEIWIKWKPRSSMEKYDNATTENPIYSRAW